MATQQTATPGWRMVAETPPGEVAISVEQVVKTYGDFTANSGVDLTVLAGETLAILGPNGAGKTTLVEMMEGFRTPTSGTIKVLGTEPHTGDGLWRSRIGVVLQTSTEGELLTPRQAIESTSVLYSNPVPTEQLLDDVGLTAKADTKARSLSGGQRRRLDVALGLIGRPDVLFVDEPTTGFDPEARREFWALLQRVQADLGTTIVLTTHYLDEAEALADRIAILVEGRIVALDTPDRVGRAQADQYEVSWLHDGERRTEFCDDPVAAIAAAAAASPTGTLDELRVLKPSLEDVYLDLIKDGALRSTAS